jgi:hypothetical protein
VLRPLAGWEAFRDTGVERAAGVAEQVNEPAGRRTTIAAREPWYSREVNYIAR